MEQADGDCGNRRRAADEIGSFPIIMKISTVSGILRSLALVQL
jgi:hypothetical protein